MFSRLIRYSRRLVFEYPKVMGDLGICGGSKFFFWSPIREALAALLPKPYSISLRDSKKAWLRPGTSDRMVFDQIFVFGEYSPLLRGTPPDFIIDLGANCGLSSLWFLTHFPDAMVIYVEPDRSNFDAARRNLSPFTSQVCGVNAAVWDSERFIYLEPPTDSGPPQWGMRTLEEGVHGERVSALPLDRILEKLPAEARPLLKIDIEGAEERLFDGAEKWLARVDTIAIEIHGDDARRMVEAKLDKGEWKSLRSGELEIFIRNQPLSCLQANRA